MVLGRVFQAMRQSRGLTLKEVTGGEFSPSLLSRFERGETALSADKLLIGLKHMFLDPGEFGVLLSGSVQLDLEVFLEQLHLADRDQLYQLLEREKDLEQQDGKTTYHRLNRVMIAIALTQRDEGYQVSQAEQAFLHDYLFRAESWGAYELLLFQHTCPIFSARLYYDYSREMVGKMAELGNYPRNRRTMQAILLNGFFLAVEEGEFALADWFDQTIARHFDQDRDAYLRMVYRIAQGYRDYCLGDEAGLAKIEAMLAIFDQLDMGFAKAYYQALLEKIKGTSKN